MRYLLDTHVVLWLLGEPEKVSVDVRAILASRSNELLVSAVSALEVATKVRLGKLDSARTLIDTWAARIEQIGCSTLDVTTQHALLAGSMDWAHHDPFDRLLAAQTLIENLRLVTTDPALVRLPTLGTLTW